MAAALARLGAVVLLLSTLARSDNADPTDTAAADAAVAAKAPAPAPVSAGAAAEIWWVMLSKDHECSTDDVDLDDADTIEECAMRCAVFEGCQYFIFGHGDKKHKCWFEATSDGCQADGHLVENDYSLYQIKDSDVNRDVFTTLDASFYYYRMIVTDSHAMEANASFCVEDIVLYDGNNTPIDTTGGECSQSEMFATLSPTSTDPPTRACCLSTTAVPDHGCAHAFDRKDETGWFCSANNIGYIGYQFTQPTYVHSYAVHDVYGVHALDPKTWTLQASNDGIKWEVLDTAMNTPWISEDGVYFNLLGGVSFNMVYRDAECSSPDIMLGVVASVEKCAEACANINGCEWFIFGKGEKHGRCYYEITADGCEVDGHPQRDDYDLYIVQRSGATGDGGASVGEAEASVDTQQGNCGAFFGSCSNAFLLLFLVLTLAGGIWLVRSILRKRYARLNQGVEYDAGDDNSEA